MERSRQLSDIRATDAPAFRLKASITLYGEKGANEGTHNEYWVSGTQWRRETVTGDFHRIEVGMGNKRWLLDSTKDLPPDAVEPGQTLAVWKLNPEVWKAGTIREKALDGQTLRCLETKPNPMGGKSALCFDKATGFLVAKVVPHELQERIADQTCRYNDYQKFGEKTFPRLVRCFDDGKLRSEIRVIELNTPDKLGAELFAQPDGAQEAMNCQGVPKAPKPVYTPDPVLPRKENPSNPVVLWVRLGKDGKPQDLRVVRSIDKAFDSAAVDAVRRRKFEPAKCEGEPIETQTNVEVVFRVF